MKRATECGDVWATAEEISIHALVKRATILQIADELKKLISIHALVKRATYPLFRQDDIHPYFNPRPREEGDDLVTDIYCLLRNFNPRPREEGDIIRFNIFRI